MLQANDFASLPFYLYSTNQYYYYILPILYTTNFQHYRKLQENMKTRRNRPLEQRNYPIRIEKDRQTERQTEKYKESLQVFQSLNERRLYYI